MAMTDANIQLLSDKVIENAAGALAIIGDICADVSTEDGAAYSGVAVHILKATAEDYNESTNNYGNDGSSDYVATVGLTNHKKATFAVTDKAAGDVDYTPAITRYAPVAGKALGRAAYDAVVSAIAANVNEVKELVALDTSVISFCALIAEELKKSVLNPADCVLVLDHAIYAKLIKELPASVIGTGDYMASGAIGAFLGFRRVISGNTGDRDALVAPMGSIAFAARTIPFGPKGNTLLDSAVMVDPASGVGIGFRAVRDEFKGKTLWNFEILFGVEATYDEDARPNAPKVIGFIASAS